MGDDRVTPLRRIAIVFVVLAVAIPVGVGSSTATSDSSPAQTVRTVEEIRANVQVAVTLLERGDRSAAVSTLNAVANQQWGIIDGAVRAENQTLAVRLNASLHRAPNLARNRSAAEFETWVQSELVPMLERAEAALIREQEGINATYHAKVVGALLEHGAAEYAEGVSSNGTVTDQVEYLTGQAYVEAAHRRYRHSIQPTLSEHAAEELSELFEQLTDRMNRSVPPADVRNVLSSTTAELAEYTGYEADGGTASAEAIQRIEADLHEALEAYRANNSSKALAIIEETYLTNFEGLEGTLIAERPELVEELEADFNEELPALIRNGSAPSAVQEKIESMESKLHEAAEVLAAASKETISLEESNSTTSTTESTSTQTPTQTPTETTTAATTETTTPGFGPAIVVGGVVLVGLLVRLRHRRDRN
ncbi:MAG: hypothetical protein ABEJ71_04230 [Halodesulfurarchaeum sp.]